MGKQEGESRWWAHSKSSTVLLDPAAFVENWKRQIQGKDGIPLQQQRLTFKVGNQEEEEGLPQTPKDSTCGVSGKGLGATDLIQDLQTWKALLRCNDVILGKLENPLVEAESEQSTPNLYCQAAQELRNIGIPCNVFYLSFDKWIPATWQRGVQELSSKSSRKPVNLSIEIDKTSSYRIDLVGRIEGRGQALVFQYRMNGGEFHTQLSMQQQTVQYRRGQQMRHKSKSQSTGKGIAGRDSQFADNKLTDALFKAPERHLTHFSKTSEFTTVVSRENTVQGVLLTVVTLPPEIRDAVKEELGVFSWPTHLDSTEKARPSSHRAQLEQSNSVKSLNHIPASHTVEHAADTSLHWLNEQQSSPSTSEDHVSSSCTPSPVETGSVCGGCELDPLQDPKEGPSGKQLKKKKKKKAKKKPTKALVQSSETLTHDEAAVSPVGGSDAVDLHSQNSLSADVKTIQVSPPVQEPTISSSLENIDQASPKCGKLTSGTKKSRVKGPSNDQTSHVMSNVAEITTCPEETGLEMGGQGHLPSLVGYEWQQGASSGCDSESATISGNLSPLPWGVKRPCEILNSEPFLEKLSSQMGCLSGNGNLQTLFQCWNGRTDAEKSLLCGLNKAATYCANSGRLASLNFLKDVYTSTGGFERFPINGPVIHESPKIDSVAARNLISDHRKICPGSSAGLDSLSVRGGQTLHKTTYNGDGEGARDCKASTWGGGSRNGRAGGGPPEGSAGRGQGRSLDERRGPSSNNNGGGPSQSSGRFTSQGGGGFASGGGSGNRGFGGSGTIGSGGGGWESHIDWHYENMVNGNKERRNTPDVELRHGFVASRNGDLMSDDYPQRRKYSGTPLDHRVRRTPSGDAFQNGNSGNGYGMTMPSPVNIIGKENNRVWKPKLNSHEDELIFESSHLRSGDSGEGNLGTDPHEVLCLGPPVGSTCGSLSNHSYDKLHSNGYALAEGSTIKDFAVGSSEQYSRRGMPRTGQNQSVREANLVNLAPVCSLPTSGGHYRHRNIGSAGNSHTQEVSKPTWRKRDPLHCSDEQLPVSSKSASEVSHFSGNGRNAKCLSVRPIHFSQQTPNSKDSHAPDALHPFGTRSAPSTPYSHSGESNFYESREYGFHQDSLSGSASHARYHANGGVGSGHVSDSRAYQDDTSQRWRGNRRVVLSEHDKRLPEKSGGDKERVLSTVPIQKWVPVDKGPANVLKLPGNRECRPGVEPQTPASGSDGKETETLVSMSSTIQADSTSCLHDEAKKKPTFACSGSTGRGKDDASGSADALSLKVLCEAASEPLTGPVKSVPLEAVVDEAKVRTLTGIEPSVTGEHPPHTLRLIVDSNESSSSLNGDASFVSRQGAALNGNNEKVLPSQSSVTDRLDPSTAPGSSQSADSIKVVEKHQVIDAATQHLNFLVTEALLCSRKGREVSEGAAVAFGAPLADFERVLCAVTPTIHPIPTESKETCFLQPSSSSCNCSMSTDGRNDQQMCSCQLVGVPLSDIWQWYEKPSVYGVEVQAQDTLRDESGTDMYLSYFVPYLSGIQLYGYRQQRSSDQGRCLDKKQSIATVGKPGGDTDQGAEEGGGESVQLLFEFFEGDQPQYRQPLLQKIQDLLRGETSGTSHMSGDALYLHDTLLGDLHPASWFAVAWYPIYRISDGPLRSVFLTYHSLHHTTLNSELRCSLGQSAGCIDGLIAFPVVGLECYNTQSERWLSVLASIEAARNRKGSRNKLAINPAQVLKQRLDSLQTTAATMARKLQGSSKHSDYEFFVSRRR